MSHSIVPCAVVLFFALGAVARADLVAADSFDDKSLGVLSGQFGGSGDWIGAYSGVSGVTVVSGGLNYASGAVFVQGGSQSLRVTNIGTDPVDAIVAREFTGLTGPVYFSFLFRPGQQPEDGTDGDFVQFLLNNDTNELVSGSIGMGRTASANPFFSRVNQSGTAGDTDNSIAAQGNTTYLLVGRFTKNATTNYNQMSLWVNPSSLTETAPLVTSSFDTSVNGTAILDFFTMRTADINSGENYFVDELRIGTSFDAVVVPEPATWLMCGWTLAGAMLCGRRWQRRPRHGDRIASSGR